jgi:hypothetical protein
MHVSKSMVTVVLGIGLAVSFGFHLFHLVDANHIEDQVDILRKRDLDLRAEITYLRMHVYAREQGPRLGTQM